MVVVCSNPLSAPDGGPSPNGTRILNGSGKIVLILDPASKSDLDILSDEFRSSVGLSTLPQKTSEGVLSGHPSDTLDLAPLDAPARSAPETENSLSRRQRDVMTLIVQGLSNKEIARILICRPASQSFAFSRHQWTRTAMGLVPAVSGQVSSIKMFQKPKEFARHFQMAIFKPTFASSSPTSPGMEVSLAELSRKTAAQTWLSPGRTVLRASTKARPGAIDSAACPCAP